MSLPLRKLPNLPHIFTVCPPVFRGDEPNGDSVGPDFPHSLEKRIEFVRFFRRENRHYKM